MDDLEKRLKKKTAPKKQQKKTEPKVKPVTEARRKETAQQKIERFKSEEKYKKDILEKFKEYKTDTQINKKIEELQSNPEPDISLFGNLLLLAPKSYEERQVFYKTILDTLERKSDDFSTNVNIELLWSIDKKLYKENLKDLYNMSYKEMKEKLEEDLKVRVSEFSTELEKQKILRRIEREENWFKLSGRTALEKFYNEDQQRMSIVQRFILNIKQHREDLSLVSGRLDKMIESDNSDTSLFGRLLKLSLNLEQSDRLKFLEIFYPKLENCNYLNEYSTILLLDTIQQTPVIDEYNEKILPLYGDLKSLLESKASDYKKLNIRKEDIRSVIKAKKEIDEKEKEKEVDEKEVDEKEKINIYESLEIDLTSNPKNIAKLREYIVNILNPYFLTESEKVENSFYQKYRENILNYIKQIGLIVIYLDDRYLGTIASQFKHVIKKGHYNLSNITMFSVNTILQDLKLTEESYRNIIKSNNEMIMKFYKRTLQNYKNPILLEFEKEQNKIYEFIKDFKLSEDSCEKVIGRDSTVHYIEYEIEESDEFLRDNLLKQMKEGREFSESFKDILLNEPFNRNMERDFTDDLNSEPDENKTLHLFYPYNLFIFKYESLILFFSKKFYLNPITLNHFTTKFIRNILFTEKPIFGQFNVIEYQDEDGFIYQFEENFSQNFLEKNIVNPYTKKPFSGNFIEKVKLKTIKPFKMIFYKNENGLIYVMKEQDFEREVRETPEKYSESFVNFVLYATGVTNIDEIVYYNDPFTNKIYCFNLLRLKELFKKTKKINPYTNQPFSDKFVSDILRLYQIHVSKPFSPKPKIEQQKKEKENPRVGAQRIIDSINQIEYEAFKLFTPQDAKTYYSFYLKQPHLENVLNKDQMILDFINSRKDYFPLSPGYMSPPLYPDYDRPITPRYGSPVKPLKPSISPYIQPPSPEYIPPPSPEYGPPSSPEYIPPPSPEYGPPPSPPLSSPIINPNYGQLSPEHTPPPSIFPLPPSPSSPEYIPSSPHDMCTNFEFVSKMSADMQSKLVKENKKNCEDWQHKQFLDFVRGVNEKETKRIAILLTPYIRGNPYQIKGEMMLKDELARKKSEIDQFIDGDKRKEKYYGQITTLLDPFARFRRDVQRTLKHGKKSYITNAFLKCWEMIYTFNLIPDEHSSDYTVFGNAEFPGAFIFAINKYITEITRNPRYKWYANSLFPDKKEGVVLGDEFKLYENYPDNWLMDAKENDGDVTKLKTVDAIRKKLGGKVDLYTSDIGIGLDISNFNKQEEIEAVLNLGQVLCALSTLKIGGCMVCKMFMFFTPFNISLLSMLNNMFEEFYLSKPVTSRPGNSEIYIVGKGYKGYKEDSIEILRNALSNWNENSVNIPIAEIKEEFYSKILNSAYQIYKRQIRFVGMNIEISNRCYEKGIEPRYEKLIEMNDQVVKDELRLREKMKDEWILDYHGELLYNPTKNDLVKM